MIRVKKNISLPRSVYELWDICRWKVRFELKNNGLNLWECCSFGKKRRMAKKKCPEKERAQTYKFHFTIDYVAESQSFKPSWDTYTLATKKIWNLYFNVCVCFVKFLNILENIHYHCAKFLAKANYATSITKLAIGTYNNIYFIYFLTIFRVTINA